MRKEPSPKGRASILHIERTFISGSGEFDVLHPLWRYAHQARDLVDCHVFRNLVDCFVVDVGDSGDAGLMEPNHGSTEDVSGDCLDAVADNQCSLSVPDCESVPRTTIPDVVHRSNETGA